MFQGDLELSESLFRKSLDWRTQRRLEEILAWRPPRVMREFYPGGFLGYDEASCPVWLIPFGTADVRGNTRHILTIDKVGLGI